MKDKIFITVAIILAGCIFTITYYITNKSKIDSQSIKQINDQYNSIDFNTAQEWVKNADANLIELDILYSKSRQTKNVPFRFLINEVKDLWLITGNCLFEDIRCEEIPQNIELISNRYRKFIYDNREKTLKDLWEPSIKKNIDLIKLDGYCIQAIIQITKMVDFNKHISIHDVECPKVPEIYRLKAWKAMNQWFEQNKDNMKWNDHFEQFYKNSRYLEEFELPKEASDTLNAIDWTEISI